MDWVKIIHILCVMGWMTSIFAVPRALIYWRREWETLGAFGPLGDLTVRLYRFSAGLAVIAVATGLWLGWRIWDFAPWVHLKIAIATALAAHYVWTGILVARARKGNFGHSDLYLRIFNEISVLGAIAAIWAVVVKPF
ncbi:MAG: CopD family protein [Rhodobacter sp.]|nr:CopD family protein [Rhodobacter sp.]MBK8439545.1 CopD family protein [Rhodobacter sp.]